MLCSSSCKMMGPAYRDGLKGGPVLIPNSQAGTGRNFSEPRAHLLVNPCTAKYTVFIVSVARILFYFIVPLEKLCQKKGPYAVAWRVSCPPSRVRVWSRAYLPSVPLLCIQMSKLYGDSTILKSVRNIGIDLSTVQNSITENSPIISRLFFVRKISIISGIDPGGPTHFCIYHVRIWHSCNLNALNRSRKLRGGGDVSQKRCSNQLLFRTKCREPAPAPVSMKDILCILEEIHRWHDARAAGIALFQTREKSTLTFDIGAVQGRLKFKEPKYPSFKDP